MKSLAEVAEALGFTVTHLAKQTNIDADQLKGILAGTIEPNLRELKLIAAAMNVTLADLAAAETPEHYPFLFRDPERQPLSTNILTSRLSRRLSAAITVMGPVDKPRWLNAFGAAEETFEEAARLADLFRHFFCSEEPYRPLTDLPQILARQANVLLFVVDKVRIDGASGLQDGWPVIFLSRRFPPRMLFTLAHELGHLVSHHNDTDNYIYVDPGERLGRDFRRPKGKQETFADAFASNLLLPADGVGLALGHFRERLRVEDEEIGDIEILHLAYFFGVSFEVAAIRCEQLKLLPRGGARSLYDELVRRHRSPENRAKEVGVPPRSDIDFSVLSPGLINRTIVAVESGDLSLGMAAEMLGVKVSDVVTFHAERLH